MVSGVGEGDSERVLESLGQSLKIYRQQLLRCTQAEMAKRLGVSRSTYVRMESGDPRIPIGYWANAWRRLYRDKTQNLTVLDAVREAADPGEAIARYDAARAYAAHQASPRSGSSPGSASATSNGSRLPTPAFL